MIIDPEFMALIPRPSEAERAALEASLLEDGGPRDPLIVWEDHNGRETLIDGHTRMAICRTHGLSYHVKHMRFASRDEAKRWALAHQLERRNLSPDQQAAVVALSGVEPPAMHGTLPPFEAARELFARVDGRTLLARVLRGECSVRQALNHSKRKAGELPRRAKVPAAPAAPAKDDLTQAVEDGAAAREAQALRGLLRKATGRIEVLERQIADVTRATAKPLARVEIPTFATGKDRVGAAVALLSDVHAGAQFDASASTFGNAYSPEICRARLGRWFAGVEWLVRAYREVAWDVRDLLVWEGGDLVDGHLHDDQRETSQSAIATIDWLEPFLNEGLTQLVSRLDVRLHLVCSYGNHGRDTVMPRRGTGAVHSYEWGMYQRQGRALAGVAAGVLADPTSHQYLEIFDRTLHFTHGDECRYQGGSGGISIPLNKAFAAWDRVRPAYLHHCGHFHQQLDGGHWLANGAVKGYDAFAMSIKGAPEPPQQAFYILDAKRGKTAVSPIWVAE